MVLFSLISFLSVAQNGGVKGRITCNKNHGDRAYVVLSDSGSVKYSVRAGKNGKYFIEQVKPGIYDVSVSPDIKIYKERKMKGIQIEAGKTLDLNIQLENAGSRKKSYEVFF